MYMYVTTNMIMIASSYYFDLPEYPTCVISNSTQQSLGGALSPCIPPAGVNGCKYYCLQTYIAYFTFIV